MAQIDYDIAMERCADFLARMIEKYGDKLLGEIRKEEIKQRNTNSVNVLKNNAKQYVKLNTSSTIEIVHIFVYVFYDVLNKNIE